MPKCRQDPSGAILQRDAEKESEGEREKRGNAVFSYKERQKERKSESERARESTKERKKERKKERAREKERKGNAVFCF